MIDDGGEAFGNGHRSGMSLRDWFAGMAIPGLLEDAIRENGDYAIFARRAYIMADEMIAQKRKTESFGG